MLGIKKVASMCILKHGDQFLLLKRSKPPMIGKYVPVGGKLEPFESPYKACLRETFEETGIQLTKAKFCGTLVESSPIDYNWMCYIYLAEIDFQPAPFCDEGILEWIAISDLLNVPTPPTDWWIYKYVLDGKPFAFTAEYNEKLEMTEMIEEIEGVEMVRK